MPFKIGYAKQVELSHTDKKKEVITSKLKKSMSGVQ